MKRILLLALLLCSIPTLAGEYIMNDTGQMVYGLIVTFSEPVTITTFGDALTQVDPTCEATTFAFSCGDVAASGGEWLNWEPTSAQLISHHWQAEDALSSSAPASDVTLNGTCAYIRSDICIVSTLTDKDLRKADIDQGDKITVQIGDTVHTMPFDYVDTWMKESGTAVAFTLWGSLQFYRIGGDLVSEAGVTPGTLITVRLAEKGTYSQCLEQEPVDEYWDSTPIDTSALLAQLPDAPVSECLPLSTAGRKLLDSSGKERILRGVAVEDPYWAAHEGASVLKRDFEMLKQWGGNVVHVPVHPEAWAMVGAEQYLENYLDPLIRWAGELGLYAIISWKTHGDPETGEVSEEKYNPDMVLARQALATLSARYTNCPWVLYSVFNEPSAFMRWDRFAVCMTALVDAVHSQAEDAIVFVPGVNVAADLSRIPSNPIPRDNVVYTADIYPWVWEKTPFEQDAERLLASGYPLLILEWGFDTREDESRFPYTCQYATSESLGSPLIAFCEEHGVSWTAWLWSDDWCPHMFYDYERMQRTAFGDVVMDALSDAALPQASCNPLQLLVEPTAAASAGCVVIDRLGGIYEGAPATIIEAQASPGWEFDHWKGPVDLPGSPIASVRLDQSEAVAAVFSAVSITGSLADPIVLYQDEFDTADLQAIDGFSAQSTPVGWWYSFFRVDGKPEFTGLSPQNSESSVTYCYPEDGDCGRLALQMREPTDLSSYDGFEIHMRSDFHAKIELALNLSCDEVRDTSINLESPIQCGPEGVAIRVPFSSFGWQAAAEEQDDATYLPGLECFLELLFFVGPDKLELEITSVHAYRSPQRPEARGDSTLPGREQIPGLEYVGMPTIERYPDAANLALARTVWDLQAWQGQLYIGSGYSGNSGPAANAGPVDVWSFDPESGLFVNHLTVDDEQIDRYCVLPDGLYIPGHDATESWEYGNIYFERGSGWQKLRTLPNAVHVYDVAAFEGLFIAVGANLVRTGEEIYGGGAWYISSDGGGTWHVGLTPNTGYSSKIGFDKEKPDVVRFTELFEFDDCLYVSGWQMPRIYRFADGSFVYADVNLFPDLVSSEGTPCQQLPPTASGFVTDDTDELAWIEIAMRNEPCLSARVASNVVFNGELVYIGAQMWRDHDWISFGLYATRKMEDGFIRRLSLADPSEQLRDLLVVGDRLLVLAAQELEDGSWRTRVYCTMDLNEWGILKQFTSDASGFSIEELGGFIYLGLGGDTESSGSIYQFDPDAEL